MKLIANSLWNLSGYVAPSILSVVTMAFIGRTLDVSLFGVYTLLFAIIGYSSIFDGGMSRAVTREISINRNDLIECNNILSTSLYFVLCLSIIFTMILIFSNDSIMAFLNVKNIFTNIKYAFIFTYLCIPLFICNQIYNGIHEGYENFKILNYQKIFGGSLIATLPALFLYITNKFEWIFIGLIVARIMSLFISIYSVKKYTDLKLGNFSSSTFKQLLNFGGWITISSIVSPIMSYLDKFIVAKLLDSKNLAYYAAASEPILKFNIIPISIARSIFPRLAADKVSGIKKNAYILSSLTTIMLIIPLAINSRILFELWIGPQYSGITVDIFQLLLIGFYFNSIAQIPHASLQAKGFSKSVAILHLIEVLPYLSLIYYFTSTFGV